MYTQEEAKQLRLKFREQFGKRCRVHPELSKRRKNFILHRTKIPTVALRFEADRTGARVILELTQQDEQKRLKAYEILERYQIVLEEGLPEGLIWEFTTSGKTAIKKFTVFIQHLKMSTYILKINGPASKFFFREHDSARKKFSLSARCGERRITGIKSIMKIRIISSNLY